MMNRILAIIILTLLAACSTYEVKDAGDGVYYAESPPEYSYVYSYGLPSWYSGFYYPYYSSCWYAPYISPYCGWYRPHYPRYAYAPQPYYGDFSIRHKYPEGKIPKRKRGDEDKKQPVTPDDPREAWLVDARSLYYGKANRQKNAKAAPAKSSAASSSSAFGKRTLSTPKQRYSRPTSSAKAPRSRSTVKTAVPRKLD